ncbi:MAG: hypothetical protein GXP49_03945 [Deltaproteobacteria bacterium]|nr:hypothetical protein [Deltaproteobacteria bacterium]
MNLKMMSSLVFAGLGMLFLGSPNASAGDSGKKVTIGVQDLTAKGVDKDTVSTLTDLLCTEVSKDKRFEVGCADDLRAVLANSGLNIKLGGCDDGECLKKLGTALNKEKFISGSVGKIGKSYVITLKMSDAATGKVEKRASQTVEGDVSKLLDGIKKAAKALLK